MNSFPNSGGYLCKCGVSIKFNKQGNSVTCNLCQTTTEDMKKICSCGKKYYSSKNNCEKCLLKNNIRTVKIVCKCSTHCWFYSDLDPISQCYKCKINLSDYKQTCSCCSKIFLDIEKNDNSTCRSCSRTYYIDNTWKKCANCKIGFDIPIESQRTDFRYLLNSSNKFDNMRKTYCENCLMSCKICCPSGNINVISPCFTCQEIQKSMVYPGGKIPHSIPDKFVKITYFGENISDCSCECNCYFGDEIIITKTCPLLDFFIESDFLYEYGKIFINLESPRIYFYERKNFIESKFKITKIELLT